MTTTYRFRRAFSVLVLLLFLSFNLAGQEHNRDSLPSLWELAKYDGVSAFNGFTTTYTKPLSWDKKDFLTAGAIVVGTGALFFIDEPANDWFMEQGEEIPTFIQDAGWYFGKPQYNYSLNGAIYLYGLFTRNEKVRKTGVLLISAASAAGLLQTISKTVVGRARPMTGEGNASFDPFSAEAGYHSFPSGHTILAVTTAYAIGKQFENPFIKGGIYALGMITPLSRLWSGAHWLTDVGLGVAISILVVDAIDNYLNTERDYGLEDPTKTKISWDLNLGPGGIGIRGSF